LLDDSSLYKQTEDYTFHFQLLDMKTSQVTELEKRLLL
jgi:hypothetical protein